MTSIYNYLQEGMKITPMSELRTLSLFWGTGGVGYSVHAFEGPNLPDLEELTEICRARVSDILAYRNPDTVPPTRSVLLFHFLVNISDFPQRTLLLERAASLGFGA